CRLVARRLRRIGFRLWRLGPATHDEDEEHEDDVAASKHHGRHHKRERADVHIPPGEMSASALGAYRERSGQPAAAKTGCSGTTPRRQVSAHSRWPMPELAWRLSYSGPVPIKSERRNAKPKRRRRSQTGRGFETSSPM